MWRRTIMIFITGPHSAGKTTLAQSLRYNGFVHIETGDIVRRKHQETAPDLNFQEWAISQEHMFDGFIADAVIKASELISKSPEILQDVMITGNRQIRGIDYLISNIPHLDNRPNLIVYVEANEHTLFQRHIGRSEKSTEGLTFEKFKNDILGFDTQMGLEEIRNRANLVTCNEGELSSCIDCVTKFLKTNGYQFNQRSIEGNSRNTEIR